MDATTISITFGSLITIILFVIAVLNFFATRKKANSEEEARLVRMETMLVNIEKNTTSLNERVDSHDKLLTKHETRISVLETKMKGGKK